MITRPGMKRRDEWLPNFYPPRALDHMRYLLVSRIASPAVLSAQQVKQTQGLFMDQALFDQLERTGHIITSKNAQEVLLALTKWHETTFAGPSLHIICVTKRCNLDCTFCHMNPEAVGADAALVDMSFDTADRIVRFVLESPSDNITFEFQGGEPFLNFPVVERIVLEARRLAPSGKSLRFTLVSNLLAATREILTRCRTLGISVSYTLNGPQHLHDRYRVNRSGRGSYRAVVAKLSVFRGEFDDVITPYPLCVIDHHTIPIMREVIDYFYDEGFPGVALIRLKPLGSAIRNSLAVGGQDLIDAYIDALDYILELNKTGKKFVERMVPVALSKILSKRNVGYVDWRNPNGDVLQAITYDFDGEILPADEARSHREMFSLGNVHQRSMSELLNDSRSFRTADISLRDSEGLCRECAYNPYCGVMPVLEFARTGLTRAIPYESEDCKFTIAIMDWAFSRFLDNPIAVFKMLGDVDEYLLDCLKGDADGVGITEPEVV